jgi:hypothetical protein
VQDLLSALAEQSTEDTLGEPGALLDDGDVIDGR